MTIQLPANLMIARKIGAGASSIVQGPVYESEIRKPAKIFIRFHGILR